MRSELFNRIEAVLRPTHEDPAIEAELRQQALSLCVLLDKDEVPEASVYFQGRMEASTKEWVNWKDVALIYAFADDSRFGAERAHEASCDAGCGPPYVYTEGGVTYAAILWS